MFANIIILPVFDLPLILSTKLLVVQGECGKIIGVVRKKMLVKRLDEKFQSKGIIMNRGLLLVVVVVLFVGSMLTTMLVGGEHGEARGKLVWEYKVVTVSGSRVIGRDKMETKLNGLGKDGWELVDFEESTFVLKRLAGN